MTSPTRRRPVRAVVGCLLGLLTAAASGGITRAEEPPDLDGLPIVRITVVRYDMFDTSAPETSSWPYRAANAVHFRSRERFLRSMLLFREGEPYSAATAAETARLLRSLGIMNPVVVTAAEVEGGVEVTVTTHDQWSLQVGADAGLSGNRGSYGFQLQEENLAGWGKSLTLGFDSDVERDTRSIQYRDPNIAGSRWTADLIHENRSDGFRERVRVERPFFALETPRAWGGWWESEELTEHLYAESESVVQGLRSSELFRGWYGLRLAASGPVTRRLTIGGEAQRVRYDGWRWIDTAEPYPSPQDLDVVGVRLGYEQISDNFEVLQGFRAWSSQEDVSLGPRFSVSATLPLPGFGDDANRLLLEGSVSVARHRRRWLVMADGWLSGRVESGDPQNVVAGLQLVAAQIGERGFQFRLLTEASHELDLDRQLTLGADVGLRGWDPDFFDGTGRALLNAQWRALLFRDVLHFFSVGAVVFVDAGQTWGPRVGRATNGIRGDAGVGLLLDLSRFSTSNVARVEIAWPGDRSGYVISISGSSLF